MGRLMLVEPTKALEVRVMAYKEDYVRHGEKHINGSCGLIHYTDYDEWLQTVERAHSAETSFCHVPATTWFSVREADGKIVGSIQLRHYLNEALEKSGGHIGFGICPSERRKGYATQQLGLVLEAARQMGHQKVMISCDKDNAASAKIITGSGGVLAWEGYSQRDKALIQHYWIDLAGVP